MAIEICLAKMKGSRMVPDVKPAVSAPSAMGRGLKTAVLLLVSVLGLEFSSAHAMIKTGSRGALRNSLDQVPCDKNMGLSVPMESDVKAVDQELGKGTLEETPSVSEHFAELQKRSESIASAASSYYRGGDVVRQQMELCHVLRLEGDDCTARRIVGIVKGLSREKDQEALTIRKYEDWLVGYQFFNEKNRYPNVQAPEHSRVRLKKREDYFNGNYVDPAARLADDELQIDPTNQTPKYKTPPKRDVFIATQAPKPETQGDFWDMIFEQHVPVIVNMTSMSENAARKKTFPYWPTLHETVKMGQTEVTLEKMKASNEGELYLRTFTVRRGEESRKVVMIHDPRWPDGKVLPKNQVEDLEARVRASVEKRPSGPIVVHCSAGVGRTGALIGTMQIKKSPNEFKTAKDIDNMVLSMRAQRSGEKEAPMVQTKVQLKLLYEMAGLHPVN